MYKCFQLIIIICSISYSNIEPYDGIRNNAPRTWALINAEIYLEPGKIIKDGTIIIRNGFIVEVGGQIMIPNDATIIDMSDKIIYPGFIESWVDFPVDFQSAYFHDDHWNFKVNASNKIYKKYKPNLERISQLHKIGFTAAHFVPDSGIFRGQSALIQLDDKGTVLNSDVSQIVNYEVDGWSSDNYPNSLLGVVALIRQTLIDAKWYKNTIDKINKYPEINEPIKLNNDLDILGEWTSRKLPFIFQTNHELDELRSINIAKEYNLNIWLQGNGYEYRRVTEIAKRNPYLILPINFPDNPIISDPYQELSYSSSELKHWDIAPDNPSILEQNNIEFSITSHGLKPKEFRKNLNQIIRRGFSEDVALSTITTIPAKKMGMEDLLGKIKNGYIANLTIVDGNYFSANSKIVSVWIAGNEYEVKPKYEMQITGKWNLQIGSNKYHLELSKKSSKYSGLLKKDSTVYSISKIHVNGSFVNWQIQFDSTAIPQRFNGHVIGNKIEGYSNDLGLNWEALKIGATKIEELKDEFIEPSKLDVFFPEGSYGSKEENIEFKNILIQNTNLWTCGSRGRLENIDILFKNGKVNRIDYDIRVPDNTYLINGKNKHVTPGLIDCHSHSAAFSINEGTQSITSEVRIQDVINSDDITIYRELAGGLTMANILHGSANTIGGQNAVIKLKWGEIPSNLLYKNAVPGIKFALGENVKQSNWGDDHTTRYPQTRMGVEQILRDAFSAAVEYQAIWDDYNNNKSKWKNKITPKRDLELEALLEIVNGKRQIHCHSYRQDEILMLTRVAEDFGFTVGTFQHVLEGYKVADRLLEHGANASTFSDWWAYKFEVIDAIPYNGSLMNDIGVNVSFNSDSRELARRMNTEAAKSIKYGGLTEEDALKFVTINPAIQLGVDNWVGSLEVGKDADFVIWSGNPLSTKTKCEQTWIEGVQYFSLEKDSLLRIRDKKIRKELVNKILSSKNVNSNTKWHHHEKKSSEIHNCLEKPWN